MVGGLNLTHHKVLLGEFSSTNPIRLRVRNPDAMDNSIEVVDMQNITDRQILFKLGNNNNNNNNNNINDNDEMMYYISYT